MHPQMLGAVLLAVAVVLLGIIAFVFVDNYHD